MDRIKTASVVAITLAAAGAAFASPSLDIRRPQIVGPAAGPTFDPGAVNGQWFVNRPGTVPQTPTVRPYEFYDNIEGFGGGPPNHLAIRGQLLNAIPGGPGFFNGYVVRASITNNTPFGEPPWVDGPNRHGESRVQDVRHVGTMFDVKLTTHWADDGVAGNFVAGGPNIPSSNPVGPGNPESNTFGVNYDELAWYSYPEPGPNAPRGAFQVPTWDFGDIQVGQTVTRDLIFNFYNPIPVAALPTIVFTFDDLFINRTNDLKIGQYFQDDPILNAIRDTGAPYPPGGLNNEYGNVSVFHNIPTPGAATLLGLAALVGVRRRRA